MVQTRGFVGRRGAASVTLPPGQYLTDDFPVLSARPTLHVPLEEWELTIDNGSETLRRWSWKAFRELPTEEIAVDIHCVTRWSKIATAWEGVSLDTLPADIAGDASYALARSFGGYTTNLPLSDLMNKQAWIAFRYDGGELPPEHGGPARLLVPHLYFWKSAKGVRGITLLDHDEPGFWEGFGYHIYGDGGSSGTRATRVAPLHRRRAAGGNGHGPDDRAAGSRLAASRRRTARRPARHRR